MRGCSRPRSASRIQTPPLQRCTHRTPGCAPLKRRRHSPARSTCAAAPVLRSSPLGADMVGKSRNMSSDMLFTPGLLGLMPPTICCVRSQSVSDLVTEISGGATPHRCGVAQSSSSELATQAWPSQPHSRLVVPVHVGSRLAHSGSPTHPSLGRLSTVPSTRKPPNFYLHYPHPMVSAAIRYSFYHMVKLKSKKSAHDLFASSS